MKKIKFMDVELFIPKNVFTPRPETELLVNVTLYALHNMQLDKKKSKILDIGTGSGNIAISLTKLNKGCKLVTLDIRPEALDIAKTNAYLNNVSGRIDFIQSDLFNSLPDKYKATFDIIVSNPPYVARWEIPTLSEMVQDEPRVAIDGGEDGLTFYKKICSNAMLYLKKGGYLIMEIGYNQLAFVTELLLKKRCFTDLETFMDDAGTERAVMARYKADEKWINCL